ncbi:MULTISPECIES: FAD-dependent oxidoreductase [Paraburkholderia]|uniref:FAD-dependent oxidoreductase n=1 Tax=Paraburkholderia TaxID=1822464 RepID=UPI00225A9F4C|nr:MULTISPECIES: FAD-dependent oxidoreductase [Paraburkholderia]MCX4170839.1 FAD-dependent oxidoreductase [Paraburkholderia madseniana]MDQ6458851.1 FAD-dependent oxidoreductase [Paraburkholderia madseniana]
MKQDSEYICDVLVVGSGCSGMSAAITAASKGLKVLVIEKEPRFGGSTARSGGWLWIPNTALAKVQGICEPEGAARTYLQHEAGDSFDGARVDAFIENGPEAVDFFTSKTAVRFDMPLVFPDYHAEAPGGTQGGRSMVTRPFDGRELGTLIKDLAPALPELTVFGMMLGSGKEIVHFMRVTKSVKSAWYVTKRLSRHFADVMKYGRGMTLTNGNALAGRLAKSLMDLNVPLWLNTKAMNLTKENGRVTGALLQREGSKVRVVARRGVVLASGGFPYDIERRKQLFPHAPNGTEHYSPSPTSNTGDGLRMAEAVGGQVSTTLPNAAAWVPVSTLTRKDGSTGIMPHFIDRAKPGVISVLRDGRRFTNEGNSYHDFVQALVKASKPGEAISAHLICDHKTLRTYGLGSVAPFPMPIGRYLRVGYLTRASSIEELAGKIGVDGLNLRETVRAFNTGAEQGRDPVFGKGSKAYNRYQGDALRSPNPCIAPIEKGPFYAIKIQIGDIGTFAGLKADASCRVLDPMGMPIEGLFAVGNDACSIMGGNYPGAGITLGPALTFGYIAGKVLAATEESTEELIASTAMAKLAVVNQ